MENKVTLLDNDIIYVTKVGKQSINSMLELSEKVNLLSAGLRQKHQPVLILSNLEKEEPMDPGTTITAAGVGKRLDFDKSASFGASQNLQSERDSVIDSEHLGEKIANFKTRQEAEAWLLS